MRYTLLLELIFWTILFVGSYCNTNFSKEFEHRIGGSNETFADVPTANRSNRFSGLMHLPDPRRFTQSTNINNLASKSYSTSNVFSFFIPETNNFPVPRLPTCNTVTHSTSFVLHSPGFPAIYPPNVDCFYSIKKLSNICSVELDLREFYLEPILDCSGDWLLIGEKKYCGQHASTKVIVPFFNRWSKDLVLRFHSNHQYEFKGFAIVGRQLPCPIYTHALPHVKLPKSRPYHPPLTTPTPNIPCDQDFFSAHGQFHSLNYPHNYRPNLICNYRFHSPPNFCTLEIFFQDFQLESSIGCSKDALILNRNGRYCGSSLLGQTTRLRIHGGSLITLQFMTDSFISSRGFQAIYRMLHCHVSPTPPPTHPPTSTHPPFTTPPGVTCDRVFREPVFEIMSVSYPLPYPNNLDCVYSIEKWIPTVDELEIVFEEFDVQEGGDGCINDYLEINTQRYCGKQTGLILRVPFSIKSVFEMRFHSDSDASIQNKGFNIRVRELDQQATTAPTPTTPAISTCFEQTFSSSTFLIISHQFPLLYAAGQQCSYNVIKSSPDVCGLLLKYIVFSLPGSIGDCYQDFISIPEAGNTRLCGELTGSSKAIPFLEQQMHFIFHSDYIDDPALGFSIQCIQLTDCTFLV